MTKPKILYYDILQYHTAVLELMRNSFVVVTLPDPNYDTDSCLKDIDVLLAPLGYNIIYWKWLPV